MNMKKYFLILLCVIVVKQEAFSQDKKSGYDFNRPIENIRDSTSNILSMTDSKDKAFYLLKLGGSYVLNYADSAILYFKLLATSGCESILAASTIDTVPVALSFAAAHCTPSI